MLRKLFELLCLSLVITSCGQNLYGGPFPGLDFSQLSAKQRTTLSEANADYLEVLQGRPPKYAHVDVSAAFPLDGGTEYYRNEQGYQLIVHQRATSIAGQNATLVGPTLIFDTQFVSGIQGGISCLHLRIAPVRSNPSSQGVPGLVNNRVTF